MEKVVAADGTVTLKFSIPQGAKGDKGSKGDRGVSISSIQRTAGNGAAGTTDTYTITLSDGSTSTFAVYNGRDGEGSGDMAASVYDPAGKSRDIFKYADDAAVEAKAASRPSTWKPTPSDIVREGYTAAGLDPIAAAMIGAAASNKSFGLPAEAITIEYSNDGGATWEDYGASDTAKFGLFALIHTAHEAGMRPELLEAVEGVNARQKRSMAFRVADYFEPQGGVFGKVLALWGLAFKANTDDMRESPALSIIEELTSRGMRVRAYDPIAGPNARKLLADNPLVFIEDDQYAICEGSDALLVATEWNQFRNPDFDRIKESLVAPVLFDGRNLYSPSVLGKRGFAYFCVGKK